MPIKTEDISTRTVRVQSMGQTHHGIREAYTISDLQEFIEAAASAGLTGETVVAVSTGGTQGYVNTFMMKAEQVISA
jgi:hypothetical protein